MSNFSLIQVFGDETIGFKGNTSTVVQLEAPLDAIDMQRIAADFNQPATTFIWPGATEDNWNVRWFAPDGEIELCGHGALAALAYLSPTCLYTLNYPHGTIKGKMVGNQLAEMQVAPIHSTSAEIPPIVEEGLGKPVEAYFINDNKHIVLLENEEAVRSMSPDFNKLRESETFGYTVTAPGNEVDFVSRTIVPHVQQLEDPATGSSHAALTPFWANILNINRFTALQLSKRGGKFLCALENNTVLLKGQFNILANGSLTP